MDIMWQSETHTERTLTVYFLVGRYYHSYQPCTFWLANQISGSTTEEKSTWKKKPRVRPIIFKFFLIV